MTFSSQDQHRHTSLACTLSAPAKVNLYLAILDRRDDGFHNLESAFTAISLQDTVTFRHREDGEIYLVCRAATAATGTPGFDLPAAEDNLATKALRLLQSRYDVKHGADVEIVKRIPSQAGLGGASSDAATTLLAANRVWQLGLTPDELKQLAAELGSDVPFFIESAAAIAQGRGERLTSLPSRPQTFWLTLMKPAAGLSTGKVYGAIADKRAAAGTNQDPCAAAVDIETFVSQWQGRKLGAAAQSLLNTMQPPAYELEPEVARVGKLLSQLDTPGWQMSGSGSCHFAICRSQRHARQTANRLRVWGLPWVTVARTLHALHRTC